MKKLILTLGLASSIITANAGSLISDQQELKNEKVETNKLNELEKMKAAELAQGKKSIVLYESNPIVQELLTEFLKQIIDNSEVRYTELLGKYTKELNEKIKNRIGEEIEILKAENTKLKKELEENQVKIKKNLKEIITNEVETIKGLKRQVDEKQAENKKQMEKLKELFTSMQDKMDSYTKYIDSKFSLKAVKEIELSRILLLKDNFPIKYMKNFNDRTQISIVLNNEKEYNINSMITERCRVSNLTTTHVNIECIDSNNKIYSNVMELEIVTPENDYILKSIDKQLKVSNEKYNGGGKPKTNKQKQVKSN